METLSKLASQMVEEWHDKAKLMTDISEAFDVLDLLLEASQGKD
ncbi:hypothetical protein ACWGH5_21875 [Streptomyces sp. NPDC054864]